MVYKAYKRATIETQKRAVELYLGGMSANKISVEVRYSTTTVCSWIKKHGVKIELKSKIYKCAVCGKDVSVFPKDIKSNKTGNFFCGKKHFQQWNRKAAKERFTGESNPRFVPKIKTKCASCGKEMEVNPSRIPETGNVYCDNACQYAGISKHFSGEQSPNWAGGNQVASYETYASQLSFAEKVSENEDGSLSVECTYCGKAVVPTREQVQDRIKSLNGRGSISQESRFYCDEGCKDACSIYHRRSFPKGFKKATSREVVPFLRQLVLKRDGYRCQKCGSEKTLHCHHILSYTQNKMVGNDPDNCITLCKLCHKELHMTEGCTYQNLQCSKSHNNSIKERA